MITEKAIKDYVWCPTLFRDVAGNTKRFKPDRKWSDTTLLSIREALLQGQSNKKAYISTTMVDGYYYLKAEPYEGDFWVVVSVGDNKLLLAFQQLVWSKASISYLYRFPRCKKPRSEEALKAESHVRVLLADAWSECAGGETNVSVNTIYEGSLDVFTTINPTLVQRAEAESFIEEVRLAYEGEIPLRANTDKCGVCWFRKECPKVEKLEVPDTDSSASVYGIL